MDWELSNKLKHFQLKMLLQVKLKLKQEHGNCQGENTECCSMFGLENDYQKSVFILLSSYAKKAC